MSENQTPSTPAPAAPQTTPTSEAKTPVSEAPKVETKAEVKGDSAPATPTEAKVEAKADAAADKVDAQKVDADKYELKVDGKTLILDRAEMIKYAQLGTAGQKRMQEAADREKKAQEREDLIAQKWQHLQQALKESPESILEDEHIGHNKIELAKKWIAADLAEKAKSPEQKKLEEAIARADAADRQLKEFEKQKQEELKKQQDEAQFTKDQAAMQTMETDMIGSIKKFKLPPSGAVVERMVGIIERAEKEGGSLYKDFSMDDVARVAMEDMKKDFQKLAIDLPDDEFESFLGEVGTNKIKASTLKKAKAAPSLSPTETAKPMSKDQIAPVKKSIKDWTRPDWSK